jgi:hypothetical protein
VTAPTKTAGPDQTTIFDRLWLTRLSPQTSSLPHSLLSHFKCCVSSNAYSPESLYHLYLTNHPTLETTGQTHPCCIRVKPPLHPLSPYSMNVGICFLIVRGVLTLSMTMPLLLVLWIPWDSASASPRFEISRGLSNTLISCQEIHQPH